MPVNEEDWKKKIKHCINCKSEIEGIDKPCPYCGFWIGERLRIDEIDLEEITESVKNIIKKANVNTIKEFIKQINAWLNSPSNDKTKYVEINKYFKALREIWKKRL